MRFLLVISFILLCSWTKGQNSDALIGFNASGIISTALYEATSKNSSPLTLEMIVKKPLGIEGVLEYSFGYEFSNGRYNDEISNYKHNGYFAKAFISTGDLYNTLFSVGIGSTLGYQAQNFDVEIGGDRFKPFTQNISGNAFIYGLFGKMSLNYKLGKNTYCNSSLLFGRMMFSKFEDEEKILRVAGAGKGINTRGAKAATTFKLQIDLLFDFGNRPLRSKATN